MPRSRSLWWLVVAVNCHVNIRRCRCDLRLYSKCHRMQLLCTGEDNETNFCLLVRRHADGLMLICLIYTFFKLEGLYSQWRTQEFCSVGVQQIQLGTQHREQGSGGSSSLPPSQGVLEAAVIWYKKFHFI